MTNEEKLLQWLDEIPYASGRTVDVEVLKAMLEVISNARHSHECDNWHVSLHEALINFDKLEIK